jgi:hypothetical protein
MKEVEMMSNEKIMKISDCIFFILTILLFMNAVIMLFQFANKQYVNGFILLSINFFDMLAIIVKLLTDLIKTVRDKEVIKFTINYDQFKDLCKKEN